MKLADEKYASELLEKAKERNSSLEEITWTEEEEKRLRAKIDWLVMPLLMFAFFALQLDRGTSSLHEWMKVAELLIKLKETLEMLLPITSWKT